MVLSLKIVERDIAQVSCFFIFPIQIGV